MEKLKSIELSQYQSIPKDVEDGERTELSLSKKCTVFETTCNLLSVLTGSGMLSLPFAARSLGWSALGVLVIIASMFMYSFVLLSQAIDGLVSDCAHGKSIRSRMPRFDFENTDYTVLGRASFGKSGFIVVTGLLCIELFMALVSFFINIGLNLHVVDSRISVAEGILVSGIVSVYLSSLNLKEMAYSSFIGVAMTALVIVSLVASGVDLHQSSQSGPEEDAAVQHSLFLSSGLPLAMGLIAFCFGGHGTFPKMYLEMEDRHRVVEVVAMSGLLLVLVYGSVLTLGYFVFGQYTLTPVTLNIGRDFQYHTTPGGWLWSLLAAVGIAINLQVTCPLVIFPLRELLLSEYRAVVEHNEDCVDLVGDEDKARHQHVLMGISVFIVTLALGLAFELRAYFGVLCGLIGSVTTITTSIFLPLIFFHTIALPGRPAWLWAIHAVIVVLALSIMVIGTTSSLCGILHSTNGLCSQLLNL